MVLPMSYTFQDALEVIMFMRFGLFRRSHLMWIRYREGILEGVMELSALEKSIGGRRFRLAFSFCIF